MTRKLTLVALALSATMVVASPATAVDGDDLQIARGHDKPRHGNGIYIVRMADPPAVAYDGTFAGYRATRPGKGRKIDVTDRDVARYADHLEGKHNDAVASVGGRKVYSYKYSFNGFAAALTADQAKALASQPGVLSVGPDEIRKRDTFSTPQFLGLNAAGSGLWNQLGGQGSAGEDMVVGIVDSGIWPEHPSVSDRTGTNPNGQGGKLDYRQLPGWNAQCKPGEAFNTSHCNQKLIGAQWFGEGFGGPAGIKEQFPYEYVSPRDADGHGTHTSTTAAGNANVIAATPEGLLIGTNSGIAPRARISTYKVCWGRGDDGGCASSDSVAAIDQAVADGVDVINFSISGTSTNFRDPVEIAFLFAADAGVFVSTSAGNNGPGNFTVAHVSPWLTTVAAGSHDRDFIGTLTLGNGAVYSGKSNSGSNPNGLPATSMVLSVNAAKAGVAAADAALCFIGSLDPAKVGGKLVVCDRGVNARTDKSLEVRNTGGTGMVLVNTSANSVNADLHYVPTIHLDHVTRTAVVAYVNGQGASANGRLSPGVMQQVPAPDTAAFSSRGPVLATADILKPDVMAPGVDIAAGVSPPAYNGRLFDYLSGTSMSSPHVAGLGALLKQKHPDWSPAMIRSALMTTATTKRNDGTDIDAASSALQKVLAYGAGQVVPNNAPNPGLVYDAGFNDYVAFICGTGQLTGPLCTSTIDPSDLNQASIAIESVAGKQKITRKATNVGPAGTYTVSVSGLSGWNVVVNPSSLTFAPGETKSYTVEFTRTTAPLNGFSSTGVGAITWTNGSTSVRSPVVVRAVTLASPVQVNGTGGPISYPVTFGFDGAWSVASRGLIPPATTTGTVNDDPTNTFAPGGPGTVAIPVTIPAGTTYARFSLFDADVAAGSDIDLYVYSGSTLVGASGSGTSAEEVNLSNPAARHLHRLRAWVADGRAVVAVQAVHVAAQQRRRGQHDRYGFAAHRNNRPNRNRQPDVQRTGTGDQVPRLRRVRGRGFDRAAHHRSRGYAVSVDSRLRNKKARRRLRAFFAPSARAARRLPSKVL